MSPLFMPDEAVPPNTTVVAVDKDKNSPHAVRWAIDHVAFNCPLLVLIHVKHKNNQYQAGSDGDHGDSDMQQLFVPYRGFCARKGVQLKEVVLENSDIAKALLEYLYSNCINSIVVGASTRSALARKFKSYDVATSVIKSAPDFCSVYVISKGKIISARAALRPAANTAAPPRQPSPTGFQLPALANSGEHENGGRSAQPPRPGWKIGSEKVAFERANNITKPAAAERPRTHPTSLSMDNLEIPNRGSRASCSRDSISDENAFGGQPLFGSIDVTGQCLDFNSVGNSAEESSSSQSAKDLEAEMKRLKLELKQTMDMYSSACKEAISAKNKVVL